MTQNRKRMQKEREPLRVSSTTRPEKLAGAIAKFHEERTDVEIVAVGAGAVNQAIKGLIMARRFVSSTGANLAFIPAFGTLEIKGKEVTAVKFLPIEL